MRETKRKEGAQGEKESEGDSERERARERERAPGRSEQGSPSIPSIRKPPFLLPLPDILRPMPRVPLQRAQRGRPVPALCVATQPPGAR